MAFRGAIFDVDGVLVDSPHELAWRDALSGLMDGEWRDLRDQTSWTAERFTPSLYQQRMAGMPRLASARSALEHFGVPDLDAGPSGTGPQPEHPFQVGIEHGLEVRRRDSLAGGPPDNQSCAPSIALAAGDDRAALSGLAHHLARTALRVLSDWAPDYIPRAVPQAVALAEGTDPATLRTASTG